MSPALIPAPLMMLAFSTTPTAKPCEVIFPGRVHAGHLGGFAADQRAAGLFAAEGDALDDLGGGLHVELAAGEIIEEEQRLRALHQDVVDAHADQVDAHGVVAIQLEGKLELGADAVGAGYQHRLVIFFGNLHQRAEAADAVEHLGTHRAPGKRFDVLDQPVARVHVYTGIAVGKVAAFNGGRSIRGCFQVEFSLSSG